MVPETPPIVGWFQFLHHEKRIKQDVFRDVVMGNEVVSYFSDVSQMTRSSIDEIL